MRESCSTCGYCPQTPSCDSCEGYSNWWPLCEEEETERNEGMSEFREPKIGKPDCTIKEAKGYLELCSKEAKDPGWGDGISFALSILDEPIRRMQEDVERLNGVIDAYKKMLE